MDALLFLKPLMGLNLTAYLDSYSKEQSEEIELLHLKNLVTLRALFKYFRIINLYYLNSKEEFQPTFHKVKHLKDTSQLVFHVPIFLTFLVLNRLVIHKNLLPFNHLLHLLWKDQSLSTRHDLMNQKLYYQV
jgi:hypothetical protein